jgi:RNA polymerase sigma-70 factor (ECF subfamily)
LGPSDDLEDLVHDVFVDAIEGVHRLRNPEALTAWVTGVAVIMARRRLQRHYRRLWLWLTPTGELPDAPGTPQDFETRQALLAAYEVLNRMRSEERIALILHRVEGLTVAEAAKTMSLSESTYKRRLRRGERRLIELARHSSVLSTWLEEHQES